MASHPPFPVFSVGLSVGVSLAIQILRLVVAGAWRKSCATFTSSGLGIENKASVEFDGECRQIGDHHCIGRLLGAQIVALALKLNRGANKCR